MKFLSLIFPMLLAQSMTPDTKIADSFVNKGSPMTCIFNGQIRGEPCLLFIGKNNGGSDGDMHEGDIYQWRGKSGKIVTFVGFGGGAGSWWFGTMNGKNAAGYNRNRGHFVFGTSDYSEEFECWYRGMNDYGIK